MTNQVRRIAALFALVLLAACSLPRGAALQSEVLSEQNSQTPTFQVVPVTRANMAAIETWPATGGFRSFSWVGKTGAPDTTMIATGDMIDLTIYDAEENSLLTNAAETSTRLQGLEVDNNGMIFVPYVNNVRVAGLSPSGARQTIQRQMEVVVPSAQVLLTVQEGQGNSVDLAGGVARPGTYPMPSRNYSIMSLISAGGGIVNAFENPVVKLLRGGSTYEIFAKDLFSSGARNTTLRPRDIVVVDEDDRTFTALGASGTEDLISFPKPRVSAIEAMALMRGLQDSRADPQGVLVLREYSSAALRADGTGPNRRQVIFAFDLTSADGLFAARNFNIFPDDTVLATESPVTRTQTIFSLFGSALGLTRQVSTTASGI
ncbi:polysaccharide biosynthesis/export family protein [Roseivivax marinus]|uniref:Polysaccharide biosynthesis/export family protein n=1 Tax=Roseivivax marinus TaxID=1379903 RepID=W4HJB5_9RHOB|nr:polysaccharide biosynthesis/export family protein [Roseivivax marinus]ETW12080.1 polysaccharide biosynthesis/export family protein [Roseivivax marinus]UMA64892.1 polysaccharide export protein [Roseivivax marinus]SEL28465.1 polysaccharide export outer membrane protein [Roseivivax marinus]